MILIGKIEDVVSRYGDRTAIQTPGMALSYKALNDLANGLARLLKERGEPSALGLLLQHGENQVIALLAALKLGVPYVPLDAAYPEERLKHMINHSGVDVILTNHVNMPPAALRGRLCGGHQGAAPPGPPKALRAVGLEPEEGIANERHSPGFAGSSIDDTRDVQGISFLDIEDVFKQEGLKQRISTGNLREEERINQEEDRHAYILFTSGSTGLPKGVPQTAENTLFYAEKYIEALGITHRDRVSYVSSFSHDGAVQDIFAALLSGATLCPLDIRGTHDVTAIGKWLKRESITFYHSVVSIFRYAAQNLEKSDRFPALRLIVTGGETLGLSELRLAGTFFPGVSFGHMYGMTESSVNTMGFYDTAAAMDAVTITLGEPLPGVSLLLLNEDGEEVEPLEEGEIFVACRHIAPGYLGDEGATQKAFLYDEDYGPIYRTGDLGLLAVDGSIRFLGRKDRQVKIRGFRVELGEIETQLLAQEGIKEALVKARKMPMAAAVDGVEGENELLAYIIREKEIEDGKEGISTSLLSTRLAGLLPDYMLPSHIIEMDRFPLTPSGKIDTNKLPEPAGETIDTYVPPADDVEASLVEIWSGILGIPGEKIGVEADFFRLGGHSLRATVLVSRIHKAFQVDFPLAEVFARRSIRAMAQYIREGSVGETDTLEAEEKREYYPQSPAQRRLFFLDAFENSVPSDKITDEITVKIPGAVPKSTHYNMSRVMRLTGEMDKEALEAAFVKLLQRHESLRTSFHLVADSPVQRVWAVEEVDFGIDYFSLPGTGEGAAIDELVKNFIRPFDLSKAPLMRVGLASFETNADAKNEPLIHQQNSKTNNGSVLKKHPTPPKAAHIGGPGGAAPLPAGRPLGEPPEAETLLLFDMHHIVGDGTSLGLLTDDFIAFYSGQTLPPLAIQYKDFTLWQERNAESGRINKQWDYWLGIFPETSQLPLLELPTDYPRPPVFSVVGGHVPFKLSQTIVSALKECADSTGATLYMIVMAALNILLHKYTGQEDIVIGTGLMGRRHADLLHVVGMFINTLPMRYEPAKEKSGGDFLQEVKENSIRAFDNQDIQFEDLVDRINPRRDPSRNPLFDVSMVVQNIQQARETTSTASSLSPVSARSHRLDRHSSKFDLTLYVNEVGADIFCTFEYCAALFKESTIQRMARHLENILGQLITQPQRLIGETDMVSDSEKEELLFVFNEWDANYPQDKTVYQLFHDQARRSPHAIALKGPGAEHITYSQLENLATDYAQELLAKGAASGDIIAVQGERSPQMIISFLAILQIGAAYLPIDPAYPRERIEYMLGDSNAVVCLPPAALRGPLRSERQGPATREGVKAPPGPPIALRAVGLGLREGGGTERKSQFVYVIYTSGTTGRPKGVAVGHRGIVNLVYRRMEITGENSHSRLSQVASQAFDAAASEIWPALLSGASLHIIDNETRMAPRNLQQWLIREKITISFQPTLLAQQLLELHWPDHGVALESIIAAGDRLTIYPPKQYPFKLFNFYGPTEDSVWTTGMEVPFLEPGKETASLPPIGKPIKNHMVVILSETGQLQPIGVPGELCVAGHGLAAGYLNNPQLTSEKFCLHASGGQGAFLKKPPPGPLKKRLLMQLRITAFIEPATLSAGFPMVPSSF